MISKDFLFAGKATFTVSNASNEHYTFKAVTRKNVITGGSITFLSILVGPDNNSNYKYMGMVGDNGVKLTTKSLYKPDTKAYRVADWAIKHIMDNRRLPVGYDILHAGKCGRCGRKLTTPESILTGLGPTCRSKM